MLFRMKQGDCKGVGYTDAVNDDAETFTLALKEGYSNNSQRVIAVITDDQTTGGGYLTSNEGIHLQCVNGEGQTAMGVGWKSLLIRTRCAYADRQHKD